MPPMSSRWALETLLTLSWWGSCMGPSGGHGGGGGAIGGEIVLQPVSLFFLNTFRLEGHQISGMRKEQKEGGSIAKR